jgi:hypothetical protein
MSKLANLAALAAGLDLVLVACTQQSAESFAPVVGDAPALMSGDGCYWLPDAATIEVDETETFIPTTGGCAGLPGTITPGTAPFGFTAGNGCNLKSTQTNPVGKFSVRACDEGSATLTIRDSEGEILQEIPLTTP